MTDPDYLAELEELEQSAGGAFATTPETQKKPKKYKTTNKPKTSETNKKGS